MLLEIWGNGVLSGEYTVTPDLYGEYLEDGNYYSADGVGTVCEITDAGENVVGEMTYRPFGDWATASGSYPRPRFVGKLGTFRITESGVRLEDMRGRWYSWDLGRFVSRDPILSPGSSPYMYALNNPLNWVDPSGMEGCSPTPPTVDPSTQPGWTFSPGPGLPSLAQMHVSYCDLVQSQLKQAERDLRTAWPLGKNAPGDPRGQACGEMGYWAGQAAMATCYFPWKAPWGDDYWNKYHPCCCGETCRCRCPLDKGGSGGSSGGGTCPTCGGGLPGADMGWPLFPPGIALPYPLACGTLNEDGFGLGPTPVVTLSAGGNKTADTRRSTYVGCFRTRTECQNAAGAWKLDVDQKLQMAWLAWYFTCWIVGAGPACTIPLGIAKYAGLAYNAQMYGAWLLGCAGYPDEPLCPCRPLSIKFEWHPFDYWVHRTSPNPPVNA